MGHTIMLIIIRMAPFPSHSMSHIGGFMDMFRIQTCLNDFIDGDSKIMENDSVFVSIQPVSL